MKIRASSLLGVSPFHLVFFSVIIYLVYTSIPPVIFEFYVNEPDWMYGNVYAYLVEAVFVVVFCLGLLFSKALGSPKRIRRSLTVSKLFHYCVFFVFGLEILAILVSYYIISNKIPNLFLDFLEGNGAAIKDALYNTASVESFQGIIPVATATIFWISHVYGQPENLSKRTRLFNSVYYTFIGIFILYLLITLARSTIIILVFGILIQRIIKEKNSGIKGLGSRKFLLVAPAAAIGFFILLGSLRGVVGINTQISELLGYGPASFNRQALVFMGKMDISGVWLTHENFGFLTSIPFLSRVSAIQGIFGTTNEPEVEYFSRITELAGLNPQYVWPGVFGSVFGELGFFGLVYVFVYGFVTYEMYKRARLGLTVGVVLYCFFAWSILFWFGFNNLLSGEITYIVFFLILARVLERFTFRKVRKVAKLPAAMGRA